MSLIKVPTAIMPLYRITPKYVITAKNMKILYDEGSFNSMKRILTDSDTLFNILDQNPQYLMTSYKVPERNAEGFYDLHWKNQFDYNYLMIRDHREDLNRAFFEYLYHPSRIQKWIEAGNDIEDYMM